MKKIFGFSAAIFMMLVCASFFAIVSSAASNLTPGSNNVIFISDDAYPGGSGKSADDPLYPVQDEDFRQAKNDQGIDISNNHVNTSFYQATKLLMKTGGTVVICGPIVLGNAQAYGAGANTKDVFTAKFGENTIKFTSVYNGVDYRKRGAKLVINEAAEIGVYGQSIWENITIETGNTERVISFNENKTLVGQGVTCRPTDSRMQGVAQYYVSLSGGHRYMKNDGKTCDLTVQSGTYNKIVGSLWGIIQDLPATNCTVNLTLEGTTTVLGEIIGTTRSSTVFDGTVNMTINGGTYQCDIFATSKTGFATENSRVNIVVNGGDFRFDGIYEFAELPDGFQNSPAAVSILDLRNAPTKTCQGILKGLTNDAFQQILWPSGTTAEDFETFEVFSEEDYDVIGRGYSTEEPEIESEDEETEAEYSATEEEEEAETKATKKKNNKNKNTEEKHEKKEINIKLIFFIAFGSVALVIAVVMILLILKYNGIIFKKKQ